jgi:Ca2+-binding EF-hand superfamily protein
MLEKERLETAFRMFDSDRSGTISTDEIKYLMGGK